MNRTQKNIIPYPVSGSGITTWRKLAQAFPAVNFFGKRSLAHASRLSLFGFLFFTINQIVYSQNCPTSGTTSLSTNPNTYYPGTQATVSVGATSITLGAAGSGANFGT